MAGTQTGRGEEPSALDILIDGLIERAQRSPLMRRTPAQCSPEEQLALAGILADLVALRTLRSSLERLPLLRLDMLTTHWPELGSLLAANRRSGSAARHRTRDGQPGGSGNNSFFDTLPLDGSVAEPATSDVAPEPTIPTDAPPSEPTRSEPATPSVADLAHLLLEALTVQGKALNTTQMLTWLQERGNQASREEVMNTLFRHEELFRRRGTSQWVVASQEA